MTLEFLSLIALTWLQLGFGWCGLSFLLGLLIGWRSWKPTAREIGDLEAEAVQAKKEYEKHEKAYSSNREFIETLFESKS